MLYRWDLTAVTFNKVLLARRDPAVLFPAFRMHREASFHRSAKRHFAIRLGIVTRSLKSKHVSRPVTWQSPVHPAAGGDNLFPSRLTRCSSSPFVRWIIYGDGCLHCFAYIPRCTRTYAPWAPDAARAPSGVYAISRYVSAYITTYPARAKGTLASLDADDIKSTDSQQADALRRKFRAKFSS